MDLGTFYTQIRGALGRGNALDQQIKDYTAKAVLWLERNAEPGYKYMERLYQVTLNKDATFPHVVDFPVGKIKTTTFCRLVRSDGEYIYLKKISPQEVPSLVEDTPAGYFINGVQGIVLDAKPTENFVLELMVVVYTSWPDKDDSAHWLLDNAPDVLEAQTLLLMAPWVRDARMRETFRQTRDEGLVTLEGSIIDLDQYDRNDGMIYGQNA